MNPSVPLRKQGNSANSPAALPPVLRVGQPYNPFGLFYGIFIPEALVRAKGISAGAKLTFGRLARYAGQNGKCYPAVPTLAAEIGISERQTQNHLAELERNGLVQRKARVSSAGQHSNSYEFLWHPILAEGVKKTSPEGVKDIAPEGVQYSSPKESPSEESHVLEETNGDLNLDSPSANRKKRNSRKDDGLAPCKPYPRLREALADYMTTEDDPDRVYPSDRQVVDIVDAAAGASEDQILQCLRYLKEERGLRPGARNGPRHFSWFKSTVADYFQQKRSRELVFRPNSNPFASSAGLSPEEFDSMTEAIETA